MIDICLRAETEAGLAEALPWLRDGDAWLTSGPSWALDLIGPIETVPPVYQIIDGEMVEVEPARCDERFHANLRCMPEMAQRVPPEIIVTPTSPSRVFA